MKIRKTNYAIGSGIQQDLERYQQKLIEKQNRFLNSRRSDLPPICEKNQIEIFQNLVPTSVLREIQKTMIGSDFEWTYNPDNTYLSGKDWYKHSNKELHFDDLKRDGFGNKFLFNHTWWYDGKSRGLPVTEDIQVLINKVKEKTDTLHLRRMKANMYTNQGKRIKYNAHVDHPSKNAFWTAVYHVNDCNGMTVLHDEEKDIYREIPQKENQLIAFDGRIKHYGITQDDTALRIVVNFLLQ